MASASNGWQLNMPSCSQRFSPVSEADPPLDAGDISDDDIPLSQIQKQPDPQCDMCRLTFVDLNKLKKHLKRYRNSHSYFLCCNKVEEGNHKCRSEMRRKRKSRAGDKLLQCLKCSLSFRGEIGLNTHVRFAHKVKVKKCVICDERFQSNEDYIEHTKMHGPEDKVICRHCKTEFTTLKRYRLHAKIYPGQHNFKCQSCLRQYYTESKLNNHFCIFEKGQPFACACGNLFSSYVAIVEHAKGVKPYQCCSCSFATPNFTSFLRHLQKHAQKPYTCKYCTARLPSQQQLNSHTKRVHGIGMENLLGCSTCGADRETEVAENPQADENRAACLDCGNTYQKCHTTNSRSSCLCPDCGKFFDSHYRLNQHISSAHSSHPVTCDICSKVLKTKKILQEHLKTHLKTDVGRRVAQAICPHCGIELAQKGSLSRHIILVHERHRLRQNDEPRLCKECGMLLANKAKYYSHRRQHRAMVERYPCPVCMREFNKKQNLLRHVHLVHDPNRVVPEINYACEMCPRVFRERKNLTRHYRLVHKVELSV